MGVAKNQPEVRFNLVGPNSFDGVAFVPKVVCLQKTVTASGTTDVWTVPAGSFIKQVIAVVETPIAGTTPTFTFGEDGAATSYICTTDFDVTTAGNYANSLASTLCANAKGKYYHAADTLRMTVGGTGISAGKIRLIIEYYEKDAMFERGIHFNV